MTHFTVYCLGDRVLLPTSSKTQAGFWLETEPVAVADMNEWQSVVRVIGDALVAEHPVVATPPRHNFPKPVVLAPAGVKTWRAFLSKARGWRIEKNGGAYSLIPLCVAADGDYFAHDREHTTEVSEASSPKETALNIARVIRP
jgi:hypothetical protein